MRSSRALTRAGLVDSMTVYSKDRIVFGLTCGMELEC